MTSHYFTDEKPSGIETTFTLRYGGGELRFTSGAGVFSHGEADRHSLFLINNVKPQKGADLLDLGCGYGLIGITLARGFDINLTMSDVTEKAVSYAEKNAAQNGVNAAVVKSDGFEKIAKNFDIITLNPPIHAGKDVCYRLYEESAAHLKTGGKFYIVIADKHGAKSHLKKLNEIFDSVMITAKKGGVNIFECDKPKGGQI
ncbi:MAG: methyltransferase [Ruminococcus sp.]|jgi:16S rRNA (guanine1207-N2)-methyltransferase|nr:methyltransferase [Ruminococcus sp.]